MYELFKVCALSGTGETVEYEGNLLSVAKVTDPSLGFTDYDSLCALVESLFSPEIAEDLLHSGVYHVIDGRLYTTDAARGTDIMVGETVGYAVTENGEDSYTFTVTYERMSEEDPTVVAGTDNALFTYSLVGDRWVFTEFALYY